MQSGEREIETSAAMVERERLAGIDRARRALATAGTDFCVECDERIDTRRRTAMPNARRCARCQALREHAERRGPL